MDKKIDQISKKEYALPRKIIDLKKNKVEETKVIYTKYNREEIQVKNTSNLDEILETEFEHIKWIDIIGLEDVQFIKELGSRLKIHPLLIEDILNTSQSSKVEEHEDYLFVIIKSIYLHKDSTEGFGVEQISLLLFEDMVISFQESKREAFERIDSRFKKGSYLRNGGADDLFHALLDYNLDNYFIVIESIGEIINKIEEELLNNPQKDLLEKIYNIKKTLVYIRSILWGMRNTVSNLSKNEYGLIDGKTVYYLRDVYDQVIQTIELVEIYREICSEMLSTYLSSIGNKTNDIMKVLTIFSTIFIPLSFLTGVYGMNFINFPEINWKYGYISFWVLSLSVIIYMYRFFKKRGWI